MAMYRKLLRMTKQSDYFGVIFWENMESQIKTSKIIR